MNLQQGSAGQNNRRKDSHLSSKKVSSITAKEIMQFHWRQAMQHPKHVITSFIVLPLSIILERYVSAIIIAILLAMIQAGTIDVQYSIILLALYGISLLASNAIGYQVNLFAMWGVQVRGARHIYEKSFESLMKHSLDFFNDTFTGSLVSKVNKFSMAFIAFWAMIIFQVLFFVTSAVATLVGVGIVMWQYALALLVLLIIFVMLSYFGSKFMRPINKARSESYSAISAQLADTIGGIMTVQTDSNAAHERHLFSEKLDDMVTKEFNVRRSMVKIMTVSSSVVSFMQIIALLASILLIHFGVPNAAIIYLVLTYTLNLVAELRTVSRAIREYYGIIGDSEEMMEIMKTSVSIPDTSTRNMRISDGAVDFKNLNFAYEGEAVFSDFNFHVRGGESVGVVGVSGSGKTTLTKLLLRFVDPSSGLIAVDSQPINDVSLESLREAISYVPQDPVLFHRSLRENIAYGKLSADNSKITEAARKANVLEFIEKLPDGFDTLVGERGVKLSGGQRQRIAIARAILKDAPILVLDEATSALDSESEKLIQASLETLMKGRTSIVIAHRLSTIAKLDRIIVLDDGKIAEDGTHQELLAKNGIYAKLWKHQSGGFIEE